LDVDNGGNANGTNIQIWGIDLNNNNQSFAFERTSTGRYKILTKCSNWTKALAIENASCSSGGNLIQHQYNGSINDEWILEPVNKDWGLGLPYASSNYNNYFNGAYPNLSTFDNGTRDCANFVSQCLLNSGIHFQDKWWMYRKNGSYSQPLNSSQLYASWDYDVYSGGSSPWISAHYFREYWKGKVSSQYCTGSFILQYPHTISNLSYYAGDVIQIVNPHPTNTNEPGSAFHTLFITNMNYDYSGGYYYYTLTGHSYSQSNKSLMDYANSYPDSYFVFYKFM